MKKSKFLLLVLILFITASLLPLQALALEQPEVTSPSVLLMDADSGEVLFEENADERRHPASTTKIMTALLTIEAIEKGQFTLDDTVVASDNCQYGMDEESSSADPAIEPGEILSVRDLLYCAMHASANEACNILAEYISGSISEFVVLMNQRAAELGCTNTHFNNPSGLEDPDHYSSARDLSIIAMEAVHHEQFVTLCSDDDYTIPATNIAGERSLRNTNALLNSGSEYYYEYAFGIKTGFFDNAGYCLVSAATKENTTLVSVVLGGTRDDNGDSRFIDTITLYDWVFDNYSYQTVLSSTESHINVPVNMGVDETVAARPETTINVLLPNDFDPETLEFEYVVYSERDGVLLDAPVDAGTILGEVTVSADGRVFGSSHLVATNSVDMSKTIYLRASINSILQQPIVNKLFTILIVVVALYLILVFFYAVQRIRHTRSLRQARRDRAERQALQEAFNVYVTPAAQALPEQSAVEAEEQPDAGPSLAEKIKDRFAGLADRLGSLKKSTETNEEPGDLDSEFVQSEEYHEEPDLPDEEEELPDAGPAEKLKDRFASLANRLRRLKKNDEYDEFDDEYDDEPDDDYEELDDAYDEAYDVPADEDAAPAETEDEEVLQ